MKTGRDSNTVKLFNKLVIVRINTSLENEAIRMLISDFLF